MRKTNAIKARKARARNFGGEAVLVRSMDCIVHTAADAFCNTDDEFRRLGWTACGGAACAHHVHPRQRGGVGEGRMGLFPGCARHGDEAGEASPIHGPSTKRRKFESLYSVNVPAIADAIALAHPRPLGIRGLADRFAWWHKHDALGDRGDAGWAAKAGPERLVGYDLAALMAWTRRRMESELEAKRKRDAYAVECEPKWHPFPMEQETLANAVALDLGGQFVDHPLETPGSDGDPAWSLCEQAGWPS